MNNQSIDVQITKLPLVRYEIRDLKEYFLKFWAESILPL